VVVAPAHRLHRQNRERFLFFNGPGNTEEQLMGVFNIRDNNRRRYDPLETGEDERPRRPRRRERTDWIDDEEESDYEFVDCSYDRALLDTRRKRVGLKPGRPLTHEERRLIELLDDLDAARRKAHEAVLAVNNYMSRRAGLKLTFERFLKAGGATADDLEAMIQTDFDLPPVRRRGSLRLVANNRPPTKRKGIPRRMLNRAKMNRNRRG
jgi:hypothetical protein